MNATFLWERGRGVRIPIRLDFEFSVQRFPVLALGSSIQLESEDIAEIKFSCDSDEDMKDFTEAYHRSEILQGEVDAACFEAARSYERSYYARSRN